MKLTNLFPVLFFVTVLNLSVSVTSAADESDIEATINGLENALNKNNIVQIRNLYSDEAMIIPNDSEVIKDKPAIVSFWDGQLNVGKSLYSIDVIDLQVDNNIAYLSAIWSATVIRDGNTEILDGYMNNVLQRESDGNWKIRIQNWN